MICLFLLAGIFRGCQSNSDFFKSRKVAGKKLNILDLKQTTTAIKNVGMGLFCIQKPNQFKV